MIKENAPKATDQHCYTVAILKLYVYAMKKDC